MVEEFVDRCRAAGLVSIIEPVAKAPRSGGDWDAEACIIEAARELGSLGADLYKAEVPFKGQGGEEEIRRACAQITEAVLLPVGRPVVRGAGRPLPAVRRARLPRGRFGLPGRPCRVGLCHRQRRRRA